LNSIFYLLKRSIFKTDRGPCYFIYFVTSRCPQKCQHCFYQLRNQDKEELNLEEIEGFSRDMGRVTFLLLTGGEPFLREDFGSIPGIFYRNNGVRNIAVPTNGFLTDNILEKTRQILKECPKAAVTVNVSIDGIGDFHDRIRQRKGAFKEAVQTCSGLIAMKADFPNLDVGVCSVVSSLNENQLKEIYNFVTKDLGIKIWAPLLIRGSPRNPETAQVNMELYKSIGNFMKSEISRGAYCGYTGFFLSQWITAKNTLRRDIIYNIKTQNKRMGVCYAGKLIGVMFPNGRVKPCELREEVLGNIRNFDYNFGLLWHSKEAEAIRKKINSEKCFCTHECFLTMNLFFNPKFLLRLIRERLRLAGL
jgi:MoaA/NifB/PqqE/SkfB family radical SAM enzyme